MKKTLLLIPLLLLFFPPAAAAGQPVGHVLTFYQDEAGPEVKYTQIVIDFPEALPGCSAGLPADVVNVTNQDGKALAVKQVECQNVTLDAGDFGQLTITGRKDFNAGERYLVAIGASFPVEKWRGQQVKAEPDYPGDPLSPAGIKLDFRAVQAGDTSGRLVPALDFKFNLENSWGRGNLDFALGARGQGIISLSDEPALDSLTLDPLTFGLRQTPDPEKEQYLSANLDLHYRVYASQQFDQKQWAAGMGLSFAWLDPGLGDFLQNTAGILDLAENKRLVRIPAMYLGYDYVYDLQPGEVNERLGQDFINRVTAEIAWKLPVWQEGYYLDLVGRGFYDIIADTDKIDQEYFLYGYIEVAAVRYLDDDVKVLIKYTDGRLPPTLTQQHSWSGGIGIEF